MKATRNASLTGFVKQARLDRGMLFNTEFFVFLNDAFSYIGLGIALRTDR